MYPRIGTAYRKRPRENRNDFREIVRRGPPPGLLAFSGDVAVGWCALTPREAVPWFDRTWRVDGADNAGVWSLSCFYVRKGFRRHGVTAALIDAAVQTAGRANARALEAYPFDADASPSASSTGYVSTFERAGFETIGHRSAARPIMRRTLKSIGG